MLRKVLIFVLENSEKTVSKIIAKCEKDAVAPRIFNEKATKNENFHAKTVTKNRDEKIGFFVKNFSWISNQKKNRKMLSLFGNFDQHR